MLLAVYDNKNILWICNIIMTNPACGLVVGKEFLTIGYDNYISENIINYHWEINLMRIRFLIYEYSKNRVNPFIFGITPVIVTTNTKAGVLPSFSFLNLKMSYTVYEGLEVSVKPFLEFNYLFLGSNKFNFDRFNMQAGIRLGLINFYDYSLFHFETGYAYNENKHNYYFSASVSLMFIDPFLELCCGYDRRSIILWHPMI
jgi:hypothetical protein